ncbi:MAG: ATP-binding protein [Oscillospiraceae bacterium]|nr:ATP-binding protein [Oscillospiraceae bacterium]
MATIYLICGKICSGKTYYARKLAEEKNALILSCDELSRIIDRNISIDSDKYDIIAKELQSYLLWRAADISNHGVSVILDWGFWTERDRIAVTFFLTEHGFNHEWHYLDISEERLKENIEKRNSHPSAFDYFVDEGLLEKCLSRFEVPDKKSVDVWKTIN